MSSREEQRLLGLEVARYFVSNPKYRFEGFAGLGRHGGALILFEQASEERAARRMVIKYSYGHLSLDPDSDADADLRNEYHWLKRLRGAEHIVQLVPMSDCSIFIPGVSSSEGSSSGGSVLGVRSLGRSWSTTYSASTRSSSESGERRFPTFAVEFLEWGTLNTFRARLLEAGVERLPSRLIWRLWLCMVRQCVAMAFPPDLDIADDEAVPQVEREVIKPQRYATITQNSAHHDNFVFAEPTDMLGNEHEPTLPVLKLIDFGRGKLMPEERGRDFIPDHPDQFGSRVNLLYAALSCMRLCCLTGHGDDFEPLDEPVEYYWTVDRQNYGVRTIAPAILRNNGYVDTQLRTLLVRLMVLELGETPTLEDVLRETEAAVAEKGPDHPRLRTAMASLVNLSETDETIRQIIQKHIYDPWEEEEDEE